MAEATGDVRFGRSAFGGFNRKDVIDYIDKLQRTAAAKGGDPGVLRQVERERDELARENRRLREENSRLRMQSGAARAADGTPDEKMRDPLSDESFSATAEPVPDAGAKPLPVRDADESARKNFG